MNQKLNDKENKFKISDLKCYQLIYCLSFLSAKKLGKPSNEHNVRKYVSPFSYIVFKLF